MECPTCGEPIRLGSRLCTSCGAWLIDDDLRINKNAPSFGTAEIPTVHPGSTQPVTPSPFTPPPPSRPMNAPPPTAPAGAAPGGSQWAPPSAAQRVEQPPPGGVGADFGAGAGASSTGAFAGGFSRGGFAAPVDDSIDEHTTLSARRATKPAFWTLTLPNGAVELVTDRAIVIGREPQFMPALPQARLIPVADPTRSVSKNHACFSMYGATLVVEDLGSTNGVVVTRADGRENDLGVGGRTELELGSRVELGDVVIIVGRA